MSVLSRKDFKGTLLWIITPFAGSWTGSPIWRLYNIPPPIDHFLLYLPNTSSILPYLTFAQYPSRLHERPEFMGTQKNPNQEHLALNLGSMVPVLRTRASKYPRKLNNVLIIKGPWRCQERFVWVLRLSNWLLLTVLIICDWKVVSGGRSPKTTLREGVLKKKACE